MKASRRGPTCYASADVAREGENRDTPGYMRDPLLKEMSECQSGIVRQVESDIGDSRRICNRSDFMAKEFGDWLLFRIHLNPFSNTLRFICIHYLGFTAQRRKATG